MKNSRVSKRQRSTAEKKAIKRYYAIKAAKENFVPSKITQNKITEIEKFIPKNTQNEVSETEKDETTSKEVSYPFVPAGRTLLVNDKYLEGGKKTGSKQEHGAVVIETNKRNELAIVTLSGHPGKNKTQLKNYQQGKSYFKHFVEVEDDEGNPIFINHKFRANHENQDVSKEDVEMIKDKVMNHSAASSANREKLINFRK